MSFGSGFKLASVAIVLAILLTACGHMPLRSMVKLSKIDFETTDPAQVRAAVKLPRQLQPRPNKVVMRIKVAMTGRPEEVLDFALREVADPSELLSMQSELEADTHIFAYRLTAADTERVTAFRGALMERHRKQGQRGRLTIEIRADACRSGGLPPRDPRITTYLRTAETGEFVALVRDVNVAEMMQTSDIAGRLEPCT